MIVFSCASRLASSSLFGNAPATRSGRSSEALICATFLTVGLPSGSFSFISPLSCRLLSFWKRDSRRRLATMIEELHYTKLKLIQDLNSCIGISRLISMGIPIARGLNR